MKIQFCILNFLAILVTIQALFQPQLAKKFTLKLKNINADTIKEYQQNQPVFKDKGKIWPVNLIIKLLLYFKIHEIKVKHDNHIETIVLCETKEKCKNAFLRFVQDFYHENPNKKNNDLNILVKKPFNWG